MSNLRRNWQRRLHDSCALWLASYRWPEGGAQLIPVAELRDMLRVGYARGYRDGRASKKTGEKIMKNRSEL